MIYRLFDIFFQIFKDFLIFPPFCFRKKFPKKEEGYNSELPQLLIACLKLEILDKLSGLTDSYNPKGMILK